MSDVRISSDGSTVYNGMTVDTPFDKDDQGVKVEDFLQLMIAQMSNQDFMNPADDTQYVTQLAQFATMQSMQELSHYSQTNYVSGLVGKNATVASYGLGGQVDRDVGIVTSVNLSGDKYTITVNGKTYELSQIMSISDPNSAVDKNQLEDANKMSPIVTKADRNSISIRWDAPVAANEGADDLTYDVYITDNGQLDFTTMAGVKKGTRDADNITDLRHEFTGLEAGRTYFVNVVVRNKNGDEAIYQRAVVNTPSA